MQGIEQRSDWGWLGDLARRHRAPSVLLADAQGRLVAGVIGRRDGAGFALRPAPRAYAQILCRLAVDLFPDPSGRGPAGERIHQTPIHAGQRYTLITIGDARTHEALVVDAIGRLLGQLAA